MRARRGEVRQALLDALAQGPATTSELLERLGQRLARGYGTALTKLLRDGRVVRAGVRQQRAHLRGPRVVLVFALNAQWDGGSAPQPTPEADEWPIERRRVDALHADRAVVRAALERAPALHGVWR